MANILFLISESNKISGTIQAHLESFKRYSKNNIIQIDPRAGFVPSLDLNSFDCIVFHYSIVISGKSFISDKLSDLLARYQGPKILFIQDEMRWIDATCARIKELGILTVFTVVNKEVIRKIYRDDWFDNVRFEVTLTGFVPEDLLHRKVKDYSERPIDVSYRARKLPAWCGSFAQEKWIIGDRFAKDAMKLGLKCDISSEERARIYGDRWIDFVANSKATLGVESGASFLDFTGEVAPQVDAYESQYPTASFEDVRDKFLDGRDGQAIIHVISPRCFEAAALRTLMVMYPGDYSGILEANRHYVALEKDHSNMAEVCEIISSPAKALKIIDCAYEEIALSGKWTFKSFVQQFDQVIDEELEKIGHIDYATVSDISFEKLERMSEEAMRRHLMRAKVSTRLSNVAHKIFTFIDNYFPEIVRKPVLNFLSSVYRVCKQLLKKRLEY